MQTRNLSGEGASAVPTISILGDSISTFEGCTFAGNRVYYQPPQTGLTGVEEPGQTWWMQVIGGLGGALCANGSYSGSMVQGAGFPAAEQPGRAPQLLGEGGQAPDMVLIFIGVNDYGWGTAEAQEAGRSEAAPAVVAARAAGWTEADGPLEGERIAAAAVPGAAPADAAQRFEAAYRRMLQQVKGVAPAAQLWCITIPCGRERGKGGPAFAHALRGIAFDDYNQAIRDAAAAEGCRVADAAALGYDYDALDGTHPTALGMQQLAAMVLHAMAAEGAAPAPLPPLPPQEMRSAKRCQRTTCINCPSVRSHGNPWFCVCDKQ
ncbi:SGNH/GDSL hydrolase family protein [Parvibacter caecicola]|uniref:Lysophospholipase L1-like esterase n=1 Tax=Parvibacter caecicola TaxID=747645 RepID=A0A3N0ABP8_9ACTN|nr:SGNH/GDSL hydrolase family protein [Parvibacter caecicola]MBB3171279.1 lysophospholipase L1-like esterase [Parvibacter caecicola]MCR2041157.1 GDSL-type esterase/lipase family protein [Parvibacter caecicola]RNL11650.1 GDSL family lipase [Parvibacter caecicola]TJW10747.1 SGNH/GDSL hydrolase family protein [Parvibacter caecicola]